MDKQKAFLMYSDVLAQFRRKFKKIFYYEVVCEQLEKICDVIKNAPTNEVYGVGWYYMGEELPQELKEFYKILMGLHFNAKWKQKGKWDFNYCIMNIFPSYEIHYDEEKESWGCGLRLGTDDIYDDWKYGKCKLKLGLPRRKIMKRDLYDVVWWKNGRRE